MNSRITPYEAAEALAWLSLPDVVPIPALADHLKLHPSTVRGHLRAGRLPGRKVGGRWYVTRRDLLAFLEAGDSRSSGPGARASMEVLH